MTKPEGKDDEAALFRDAVRGVKPLSPAAQTPSKLRRPAARTHFTRADRHAVFEESAPPVPAELGLANSDELVFSRAGIQSGILRKLRRGHYRIQGEIDLHGLNVSAAQEALRDFLAEAIARRWQCVRIVHGKGLRSGQRGPVLKGAVGGLLKRTGRVRAYVSARPADGGTGAVYVLLSI